MTMIDVDDAWRSRWEIEGWWAGRATKSLAWHSHRTKRWLVEGQPVQWFYDQKASLPRLEQYPGAAATLIHAELSGSVARHLPRTVARAAGFFPKSFPRLLGRS